MKLISKSIVILLITSFLGSIYPSRLLRGNNKFGEACKRKINKCECNKGVKCCKNQGISLKKADQLCPK